MKKITILFFIVLLCPSFVLADFSTLVSPVEGDVMSRTGQQYQLGPLVIVESTTGNVSFSGLRIGIRGGFVTGTPSKYYQFVIHDSDIQWLHENPDYLNGLYPHDFNVTLKTWSLTPVTGQTLTYTSTRQETIDDLAARFDSAIANWSPTVPPVARPIDALYSPFNASGVVTALGAVLAGAVAIPLLFLAFNKVSRSSGGLK